MEAIYSVSQINSYIKSIIMREAVLSDVTIRGEISNCKYHSSGHIYFTLKDGMGKIACVMFAGNRRGLSFKLYDGLSVLAKGSVGVYERDGRYQLYVTCMYQDGVGLLYERLEQLKEKLLAEGLFSDIHKKRLPVYAGKVGIVTAETGAAIKDIVNIAKRRNPFVQLVLYPVHVQGDEAAGEIAHAICELDKMGLDVIIVGRGGGSFEDLFAFNEEIVVRAIYDCNTPVVSAVGHEVDTTLSDFAADMRAPTPSAAAELCVCEIEDLLEYINDKKKRLDSIMRQNIENRRNYMKLMLSRLTAKRPDEVIRQKRQYLMDCEDRLGLLFSHLLEKKKDRLVNLSARLNLLSPLNRLCGGYSYVEAADKKPVKSVRRVKVGDCLTINLCDGTVTAVAESVNER